MHAYSIILFDLDHTLSDPTDEMISAGRHALSQFGIVERNPDKLAAFANVPLLECFEQNFGLSHEQANRAFQLYWSHQATFGPKKNVVYPGVPEMLAELRRRDRTLCVATARATKNAEDVVKAIGLAKYFDLVLGACEDTSRQTKRMVIFDLLCHYPGHNHEDVLMVGDRVADIIGAKDNGIDVLAVTYGAGLEKQLREAEPTFLVHSVKDMARLLLDDDGPAAENRRRTS
jgi:phosphoglycolate phosphatase